MVIACTLLAACASALKPPPPVSVLAGESPVASNPAQTLSKANDAWAKRGDPQAAAAAEQLYLAAAQLDEGDVTGLVGAIRAKAWRAEHETDAAQRESLAVSAVQAAQWCVTRVEASASCHYWLGIALGLQAREKPTTAVDGLEKMVAALRRAIELDESVDDAGPHRVLALVYLRAPGWPTGPGDPEQGLSEARSAWTLAPTFIPNRLALIEALSANDRATEALPLLQETAALLNQLPDADPEKNDWKVQLGRLADRVSRSVGT